ncbi:hypothetical protein LLEC1_06795 [Akanthomyces lecanii]|uniref:Uncharacterized protein n=1 Tax=Cordyceps confragosa TaxID=2714763 RepID=A0A179IIB9_CORDF|nr:hypothetical protein LLEC1_06795 [Akanthomyces lecanii]
MKFFAVVATLATSANTGETAVAFAADSSVVTCPECKTPASTNDVVTREPIPSTSCDSPPLTVVTTGGVNPGGSQTGSPTDNPTSPPITGSAGRVAGGALAAVVAVVALL